MSTTNSNKVSSSTREQTPPSDGLQAGLKNRHLSMIAIGGVIGAGLFVGSSSGIAT
ncbi:amino acid transporter, partial [Streptomyces sp. NPDC002896]